MKRKIGFGLAARLSSHVVLIGVLMFSAVLGTNYYLSRKILQEYSLELIQGDVAYAGSRIEAVLGSVSGAARSLVALVSNDSFTLEQIDKALQQYTSSTANVHGMTLAFEPGVLITDADKYAPYYFNTGNGLVFSDLAGLAPNYTDKSWYTLPRSSGKALWSVRDLDPGGNGVSVITYSVPVYLPSSEEFAGVLAVDMELDWLQNIVTDMDAGGSGYGFIAGVDEVIMAQPEYLNKSGSSPEFLLGIGKTAHGAGYSHRVGQAGSPLIEAPCALASRDCKHLVWPVDDTDWNIVVAFTDDGVNSALSELTIGILFIAANGVLALGAMAMISIRNLTKPLAVLAEAARKAGSGDLEVELPVVRTGDEIGTLTSDFRAMQDSLKHHISELTTATALRQKLESEIQIAQGIQMSMVPGKGNASIKADGYELFALMRPARSVGGDLYFFHEENGKLHFLIGDVSGKGVPAALFMARTVTLFQGLIKDGMKPGMIFSRVNDALCQNNDACMFVTALCGELDIKSGHLLLANAGHMEPLRVRENDCVEMKTDGGMALGIMEAITYADNEYLMEKGTSLLMYTDGISEAFNADRELYGENRLFFSISDADISCVGNFGISIMESMQKFVGEAEQSDDITLLIVSYE